MTVIYVGAVSEVEMKEKEDRFDDDASDTYIIKIGNYAARKVVVIRSPQKLERM